MSLQRTVAKRRISDTLQARNQQRRRCRKTLLKKAYEYGVECDADVYLLLRIRKNGQTYTPTLTLLSDEYHRYRICVFTIARFSSMLTKLG